MNTLLQHIQATIYDKCALEISNFTLEKESKEYDACQFQLNDAKVICRNAKLTPKKVGQFVTFWKRSAKGPIAPFDDDDDFDFFVVNIQSEQKLGQFVFPKSILLKKGVISTPIKEGKRAFRVYPIWDITTSAQAIRSQKWQLAYFYEIGEKTDLEITKARYEKPL